MAARKKAAGEIPKPKVTREGFFQWVVRAGVYPKGHDKAGDDIQFRLTLRTKDEPLATESMTALFLMRDRLVKLGRGVDAEQLLKDAALHVEEPELFAAALMVGDIVEAQAAQAPAPRSDWTTWASLGRAWLSGDLMRRFPHLQKIGPPKTTDKEEGIIDYLEPFIGQVTLESFNLSHYNLAMGALPPNCKRDTARRHYHQTIMRIMRLARKCKLITVWQLDEVEPIAIDKKSKPEFTCLRPEHIQKLIPSPKLERRWRMLWGFMMWESPRIGYLPELEWRHIETDGSGAVKMESKNGEVLYWDLRPGTLAALLEHKRLHPKSRGPFDWLEPAWKHQAAKILRKHLMRVGADDEQLHKSKGRFRKLRAHDLRATFIVFAKLEGRSESWIMDRTGHHSSEMIQRYDRLARVSMGKGWTALPPLTELLGVAPGPAPDPNPAGGPDEEGDDDEETEDAELDALEAASGRGTETGGAEGAQGRRGAPEGASERGAVTTTVTARVLCPSPGAEGGPQVMETIQTTTSDPSFRRTESNRNSGIQRPAIDDGSAQNSGGSTGRDTQEGTGSDELSRLAVTPQAAYAAVLDEAMHLAIRARAPVDDIANLRRMSDVAHKAATTASAPKVVELAVRRREGQG